MSIFSTHYHKLRLLKLPIVAVLLVFLWVGVTGLVVLTDIFTLHQNLSKLNEINRISHNRVLEVSNQTLRLSSRVTTKNLDNAKGSIESVRQNLFPLNIIQDFPRVDKKWPTLNKSYNVARVNLEKKLDNNLTKINHDLCQGDKINQINQLLFDISKVEIKPYSKAIISELEASFGQIKTSLQETITLNRQLTKCYSIVGASFVSQEDYYSMIRFGKYLSATNQVYSRIIQTLKAEDRTALNEALEMLKGIDINNFVTLKADFAPRLESAKNIPINKDIDELKKGIELITTQQNVLKNNLRFNWER